MANLEKLQTTSAVDYLPARLSLSALREAASHCEGCPLYKNATQTVFGEGKRTSRVILVGEQPGNDEDLAGKPFVGPAGRVLDQALEAAGIDRELAYVTNAVKHFKWTGQGKRRMHKTPSAREVAACLPWLEKEIELIKPDVVVCLGATAAKALLGRDFRVTIDRGRVRETAYARQTVATVHPSSILRQPTREDRERAMHQLVADLKIVAGLLDGKA
jgi:uracil-DNA glycosylase